MVAIPHHLRNADPDPAYPAFHFNAAPDPDPAPHQSDTNLRDWSTEPLGLHFEPPRLHCKHTRLSMAPLEPLMLLNVDFKGTQVLSIGRH